MKSCNKWLLLILMVLFGLSAGSLGVFAENPPLPSESDIQKESTIDASKKVQLKAPIQIELTEEEKIKAEQEAKIREEFTNEQKQISESTPLHVEDKDFDPNANEELTQAVIPNTGSELMKLISMFAKVMLGVLIATFMIYFLLLATRNYFHPKLPSKGEEDFDIRDLNSPKTTDEALKSFLDRTGE